jgi:hypothetical protein
MANFDFRFVNFKSNDIKESDDILIEKQSNESELEFYNRKAVQYTKDLSNKNYHGKTLEEFKKEIDKFNEEWQKVIDRDPIIGKKNIID